MPSYYRIYTGEGGISCVREEPHAMQPFRDSEGSYGEATSLLALSGIIFRVSQPGYVLDWHCAPRRQLLIGLKGACEIEAGDGTRVRVGPGDVALAEDLTGKGHITRVIGDEPRFYAILPLA